MKDIFAFLLISIAWSNKPMLQCEPFSKINESISVNSSKSLLGITLLEVLAAIAIALTLGAILLPALVSIDPHKEKIACMNNLRQLRIAFSDYAERGWPQLPSSITLGSIQEQEWWLKKTQLDLGLTKTTWQCPTLLRKLKKLPENQRPKIHYLPTPFSAEPNKANTWPKMPWFIEIGNAHKGGNLLVRANGDIEPASR